MSTMARYLILLLLALILIPQASAQPADLAIRQYRINNITTAQQRTNIVAQGIAIDSVGPDWVEITATPADAQRLAALGYNSQPIVRTSDFPPADAAYHNYAEMVAEIQATAAAHPEIVQLFSIGNSYEGRALWAAKISDNVAQDEDEPEALFVGQYHAREHLTPEMMLYLLDLFTSNYGSDPQITRLVDTREIYLIFSLNPDGSEYDIATGEYRLWRKNRQPNSGHPAIGTDLNRNHSYRWDGIGSSPDPSSEIYRGSAPASAPEVAAMEAFVNSRVISGTQQIRVAISFHTFGELILWPYGYTYAAQPEDMPADDAATFVALGQAMAATNGYTPHQGSHLYLTNGDFLDWSYGVHRIFSFTFEMFPVWNDFYPSASVIAEQTARNREAVLLLLEYAACPHAAIGPATCTDGIERPPLRTWLPIINT